jgi:hypothetical protein
MFNINGTTKHPSLLIPIKNLNQLANCSDEKDGDVIKQMIK